MIREWVSASGGLHQRGDTAQVFRALLDQMIDLRHPFAVLATRILWEEIESLAPALGMRPAIPS